MEVGLVNDVISGIISKISIILMMDCEIFSRYELGCAGELIFPYFDWSFSLDLFGCVEG